MTEYLLFTDGSVHPQTKDGYGAALLVKPEDHSRTLHELSEQIQVFKFTETSSSRIELQTLLRALADLPESHSPLTIYTDSQNILSLADRRSRLEANDFYSSKGKLLKNAELYRRFFEIFDERGFRLVKIKGHKPVSERDSIDQQFNLVDKAARKACRSHSVSR